jgi:catechol 2,3-dioxygenase-like lactoylglutathione lyase family enzyme
MKRSLALGGQAMSTSGLNHYTLWCAPQDLPELVAFYGKYLQLTPGDRPVMPAPGYWLYCGSNPIVHLYAGSEQRTSGPTGALDHISFRAHNLEQTRAFLRAEGVAFEELPVPGWPLHQIFLRDPLGLKIELTFDLNEEGG